MLIEGGYLHSLKALLEKAKKTPDPTPPASADQEKPPAPSAVRKPSSSASHGTVSPATVRHLAAKQ